MHFTVTRFVVDGPNPLDAATTQKILEPFLGDHAGLEGLLAAGDALEKAITARGNAFLHVVIPPQPTAGGVIHLQIGAYKLGKVDVAGNKHFPERSARRSLPALTPGVSPDMREISRQLAVANEHPRRQERVAFKPSETEPEAVDATIRVSDQRPWMLFAGLDNIGTEETGPVRTSFGGQYANVSGHDDIFTGTFTTSPDHGDSVKQFGFFYQLPVYPLQGWFSGFYVRSDVEVGNFQNAFNVTGAGEFWGLSFKRQLLGVGRYRHSLTAGVQDRLFDSATSVVGTSGPGVSSKVRSRPITFRYDGGYTWTTTAFDFYADYTRNLHSGAHNRLADYARSQSTPGWQVMRFGATVTQELPRSFLGIARVNGQYSNNPLIAGEQFGLGGETSVRGFEERTIAGDRGLQMNLEVWSPVVPRLYGVRFLAFVDGGYKYLARPTGLQVQSDVISSAGVGARWQWKDQLALAVDYGRAIAEASGEASDRGNSKWHVNLQYRY